MKWPIFSVLFILCSLNSHASCMSNDIDLRQSFPRTFSKIGVYNQGKAGTCYAYSASTIIDFFRFNANPKVSGNTSPLEAGVLSKAIYEGQGEDGGSICNVINAVSDRGYSCDKNMIYFEEKFIGLGIQVHRELVNNVFLPYIMKKKVYRPVGADKFDSKIGLSQAQLIMLENFRRSYLEIRKNLISRGFEKHLIPTGKQVFLMAQQIHLKKKYGSLAGEFNLLILNKICERYKHDVKKISCRDVSGNKKQLMNSISISLDALKPPGISYCSTILKSPRDHNSSECEPHASVVIGRKWSNGQCHYLLRNSWGSNFSYPWETSKGDIWLPEAELEANLLNVHIVQ